MKQRSKAVGSMRAKTLRKVSALGMPLGSDRNVLSHGSCPAAYSWTSRQSSVGPAHHRQDRDREDVAEPVTHVVPAGVVQVVKIAQENRGRRTVHAQLLSP
jgi:hypothetical protein